ncbi:cilia- and flagella-associated protein 119, partial [Mustelus asterias]
TSLGNVGDCFHYFRELLFCHSVQRPPFSVELFNGDQVKFITDYILETYFRHFKLYKYAFTPQIRMDLTLSYPGIPGTPPAVEEELVPMEAEVFSPEEAEVPGELQILRVSRAPSP